MIVKRFVKTSMAAAAVCALWAGGAQAAVFNLDLSGMVADGAYSSQDVGGFHYDQWSLGLSGLDPITVALGDQVNATITLDQLFTVPGSVSHTSYVLYLSGDGFPAINTGAHGSFAFFNGLTGVASGSAGTTTSGGIAHSVVFFPPDNGPLTFDSIQANFTIDALAQSGQLDFAVLSYTLASATAVPEPAAWALMLMGFGGLGAAMRRRRALAAA
jgi:hypothetical protein